MMPNTQTPALLAEGLSCSYGRREVLREVSLSAAAGDCIGLLGVNGGGKSTLLSILAGIMKPKSGTYTCQGHEMLRETRMFGTLIGYLPQENPLLEALSARDNLRLWYGGRLPADLPVLHQLQLEELLDKRVNRLSGGMKRRLAIACAVVRNQPVLLLDEPTASLDLYQKGLIRAYLREYTEAGGIAILSTHDPQEIDLCNRYYYMMENTTLPTAKEEALLYLREGRR